MVERVPFLSPTFPEVEDVAADYAAIVESRIFSNGGPFEQQLAHALAGWVGNEVRASLVSSGTAGIQLAIGTTFKPRGVYVLVASFTFAAGPLVVRSCGYTPAFLDIDPVSWHPRVSDAEQFLEVNVDVTAGILLTNTFGVANDEIEAWEALADQYGLALVIDSAAGFGSEYPSGERVGARGTCEVFSLHATKTMAVGEGGAVTARDPELIKRFDRIKNFGFDAARNAVELGTNAKLSELSCAIGLRQFSALPARLATRREILSQYQQGLGALGIEFQPLSHLSALAFVSVLMPSTVVRAAILAALETANVEARVYYNPPVHQQTVFADARIASPRLSTTLDIASRIVSLPISNDLTSTEVARVVQACKEATAC